MLNPAPIIIPPQTPTNSSPGTVIFLHGLGDDAQGWTGLIDQYHSACKLPHIKWTLPNAPHSRDAVGQAWFAPKPFLALAMPKHTGEAEADEEVDEEDDEEGMMRSVEYICSLVDKEHKEGLPLERIVLGGFSQGCAVSLLVGLMSRYAGRLGGVIGLSGYLPLLKKVEKIVGEKNDNRQGKTEWFLAHGTRDMLVPRRMFTAYREKLEGWEGQRVESRIYEGMGHSTTGAEVRDICAWLERVLPEHET